MYVIIWNMSILVIRHALSEANNRDNVGTMAFGAKDAPLMQKGREQAVQRAATLRSEFGVNAATTPVAISRLLRTKETAQCLGFKQWTEYPLLDEVEHGMDGADLRALLDSGGLPRAALANAEALRQNPPSERVWVTHGLVIAGLCQLLGQTAYERLIPRFCEARVLSF